MTTVNDLLQAEVAAEAEAALSQWFGDVGDRLALDDVEVVSTRVVESEYGEVTLVKLLVDGRHRAIWWASGVPSELRRNAEGEWYWAPIYVEGLRFACAATVKGHQEWDGAQETVLTRVTRVLDPVEQDFRREYRKRCKAEGIHTGTPEFERGYALGLEAVRAGDAEFDKLTAYDPKLGF